jgi:hypothetical protein
MSPEHFIVIGLGGVTLGFVMVLVGMIRQVQRDRPNPAAYTRAPRPVETESSPSVPTPNHAAE